MPDTPSLPITIDNLTLLQRLACEDGTNVSPQHERFYLAYGVPLENYLVRRFGKDGLPDSPESVVHAFLEKKFWEPESIDRLTAKYFRRVWAICTATQVGDLVVADYPEAQVSYFVRLAACELAGLGTRKVQQQMPTELKQGLTELGVRCIRECESSDADSRAYPTFRGYLLNSLYNSVRDLRRKVDKRLPEVELEADLPPEPGLEDERMFALDQVSAILDLAVTELEKRFKDRVHWEIFTAYIAEPARNGQSQRSMDDIAIELRDRIVASSGQDKDWNDKEVVKTGRSLLDALRRELWKLVGQYIDDFELPSSVEKAVRETIVSRRRNEMLQAYFELQVEQPESNFYAKYISKWLRPADELRKEWFVLLSDSLHALFVRLGHPAAHSYRDLFEHEGEPLRNLDQCWRHPKPPLDLLNHIKEAAKSKEAKNGGLPEEIAKSLYLTSIAIAFLRTGEWISSMTVADYCSLVEEVAAFTWLDNVSRLLLEDSRKKLALESVSAAIEPESE